MALLLTFAVASAEPLKLGTVDQYSEILFAEPVIKDRLIREGRVAEGMGFVAWFADDTDRYGHGVLGDAWEPETLIVEANGNRYEHTLDDDAVFEDLEPRIVDIDQDGTPEIIAIKAYLGDGATVALYGIRDGQLVALAEAEPIGRSYRWLNPAGVADFDGDGKNEVSIIRTPHIGGILIHYDWDGGKSLKLERRQRGYSTHAIGSTVLAMSVIHDWNGDGRVDLILPRQDRSILAVVTLEGDRFGELASFRHGAQINTPIVTTALPDRDGQYLVYGLRDGTVWALALP